MLTIQGAGIPSTNGLILSKTEVYDVERGTYEVAEVYYVCVYTHSIHLQPLMLTYTPGHKQMWNIKFQTFIRNECSNNLLITSWI